MDNRKKSIARTFGIFLMIHAVHLFSLYGMYLYFLHLLRKDDFLAFLYSSTVVIPCFIFSVVVVYLINDVFYRRYELEKESFRALAFSTLISGIVYSVLLYFQVTGPFFLIIMLLVFQYVPLILIVLFIIGGMFSSVAILDRI